jgi:predicted metal-binding protein
MFLDNPPCGQYIKGEVFDMTEAEMIQCAIDVGFAAAAIVDTTQIVFDPAFRPYCEENLCGQYGANYSCPPDCGSPEAMKQRVLAHKKALVLQTIWEISDYTDKPAIKQAKGAHNAAQIRLAKRVRKEGIDGFLVGASGCALCTPCAAKVGEPCRFPDLQYSCMSAYCIFVKQLCDHCGLEYDCGSGLLGFFGLFVTD